MKIVLINGSPKVGDSASSSLLEYLRLYCTDGKAGNTSGQNGENSDSSQRAHGNKDFSNTEVVELALHSTVVSDDMIAALQHAEAIVFACPLYVDGIPAHLLSCLIELGQKSQNILWQEHKPYVYGIVNCGFYEGIQAQYALELLRNWAVKSGCTWGGGIGVGGGGGLSQMPTVKNGYGPKAPVEKAIAAMADRMLQRKIQGNNYVSVAFPRFLYKMVAQLGWRRMIKANGGKTKDLGRRGL